METDAISIGYCIHPDKFGNGLKVFFEFISYGISLFKVFIGFFVANKSRMIA